MRITDLQPHQQRPDEWHISLDGAYAFTLDGATVVAEGLVVGCELSPADVTRLRAVDEERRVLDAALRFLASRPRSRAEVRRRLLRRQPNRPERAPDVVERVLARLERMHLIDDREFASFWVEQRERFSPRAAYVIGQELRARGVDRDTADAAVDAAQDAERALEAGRQKARTLTRLDFPTFRARLGPFLLRRGFGYGLVRDTVNALWEELHGARPDTDDPGMDDDEGMGDFG
jgi:regulatory protein